MQIQQGADRSGHVRSQGVTGTNMQVENSDGKGVYGYGRGRHVKREGEITMKSMCDSHVYVDLSPVLREENNNEFIQSRLSYSSFSHSAYTRSSLGL